VTLLQRAAGFLLRRAGWTISGAVPGAPRYLLVASLRAFYAGTVGRYPEQTSRVRLREEDGLE